MFHQQLSVGKIVTSDEWRHNTADTATTPPGVGITDYTLPQLSEVQPMKTRYFSGHTTDKI